MTAFRGWLDAWGESWGTDDGPPGFISGSASFSISATGTLTSTGKQPSPGAWRKPIFVPIPVLEEEPEDAFELMLVGAL